MVLDQRFLEGYSVRTVVLGPGVEERDRPFRLLMFQAQMVGDQPVVGDLIGFGIDGDERHPQYPVVIAPTRAIDRVIEVIVPTAKTVSIGIITWIPLPIIRTITRSGSAL